MLTLKAHMIEACGRNVIDHFDADQGLRSNCNFSISSPIFVAAILDDIAFFTNSIGAINAVAEKDLLEALNYSISVSSNRVALDIIHEKIGLHRFLSAEWASISIENFGEIIPHPIYSAVAVGNISILELFLSSGIALDYQQPSYPLLLEMMAMLEAQEDVLVYLLTLQGGPTCDYRYKNSGKTIIDLAEETGFLDYYKVCEKSESE